MKELDKQEDNTENPLRKYFCYTLTSNTNIDLWILNGLDSDLRNITIEKLGEVVEYSIHIKG